MHQLAMVGRRVDWLTLAFRVAIPPHTVALIELRAARAAEVGPVELCLPSGEVIALFPSRRPGWWRWECAIAAGTIDLHAVGAWNVTVDVTGQRIAAIDLREAMARAWRIAAALGDDPGAVLAARCRRLDLAMDVAGWVIERDDALAWVRPRRGVLASFVELEPSTPLRVHEVGRRITGYTICPGGQTMLRCYDKRAQLAALGDADWSAEESARWNVADDVPVTRVEYQLRGDALCEFGDDGATLRDAPELLPEALPGLWAHLTREWCRLVVPGTASRLERCALDPRWELVQRAGFGHDAQPLTRKRRPGRAVVAQAFGCALSACADAGLVARADAHQAREGAAAELWARATVDAIMRDAGRAWVDQLIQRYADAPDASQAAAEHLREKICGAVAQRS